MPGTLYVVATPIGNLEDITLRALRVLREVTLIAAEDTRRTSKLLAHYGIQTPMMSFHEHNSRGRIPQFLERLSGGTDIALVSDAGTPGISDPGVALVRSCRDRAIPVEPLPGACAAIVAAVASGFPLETVTFLGFIPSRSSDRIRWLEGLSQLKTTVVFFESPHRARRTLEELGPQLGTRHIFVAREMTKLHGEFLSGELSEVLSKLATIRGELTFVLGPAPADEEPISERSIPVSELLELSQSTNITAGRRAGLAGIARKYGRTTNQIYEAIERERKARS